MNLDKSLAHPRIHSVSQNFKFVTVEMGTLMVLTWGAAVTTLALAETHSANAVIYNL